LAWVTELLPEHAIHFISTGAFMGARTKLNSSNFMLSLFAGVFIGLLFQSWWAFLITVFGINFAMLNNGNIRIKQNRP
jgi:hypothetical protein